MKLPSSSFGPSIIEAAPRFVPGKLICTSPDSLWIKDVGCVPPN
jgi:hypothetical protein